jgi:hypothetical protein
MPLRQMTRAEAAVTIERIRVGEIALSWPIHALDRFDGRSYTKHDVQAILKCHVMETAPLWNEEHLEFRVALVGKCLQGRPTRIILGLRQDGPCAFVTIMTITKTLRRRTK